MNNASIFFLILGVILVVSVIRLVRNLKLREKYAALWLLTALVIAVLMIFPRLLDSTAALVGVVTPVNLLFLIGLVLLLGVCLHLSLEISRLEDETRVLAEEAAIQRSLLNRQLERVERSRNPTSSLPVIETDGEGRGVEPGAQDPVSQPDGVQQPVSRGTSGAHRAPKDQRPTDAERPAAEEDHEPTDPTE